MTTNEHTPQLQPSCSSSVATFFAWFSTFFGALSLIASITVLPKMAWTAPVVAFPLLGAAFLPGAIAALIPRASTRTRTVALVGLALGVLALILWVALESAYCQQTPANCA